MRSGGRKLVLIAGGGVGALEAMVALRRTAGELVDVELISPDRDFFYRPLAVGEPFGLGEVLRFDIPTLARGCGATHRLGTITSVDADAHEVRTSRNATFAYDVLLIAIGARPREAVPGALTFRGQIDVPLIAGMLTDIDRGQVERVAFALPGGVTWPLPLYELALLTAEHAGEHDLEITVVSPEESPLHVLGREASETVAGQLYEHSIRFLPMTYPDSYAQGELRTVPGPPLVVDAVVALPRLKGVPIAGVPQDEESFIPVDPSFRIPGVDDMFAVGDITTFPVKQGGIAAQQADVAASEIAAAAGADVVSKSFDPVLRGLLLSDSPRFFRAELGGGRGNTSTADSDALWWPAAKIAAPYLSPYLAEHAGLAYGPRGPASLL
ncbi:MAG: NAD(P)/FAD-dependent oxidoreductase [Gaiellaceae bacterium]